MAEHDDEKPRRSQYKEGNTAEDGSYLVGRGRTPDRGKFRKGDGRKRGRRAKGTRNIDTDILAEANRRIVVNEDGKQVSMTKQQAVIKRMYASAFGGNVVAMRDVLNRIDGSISRLSEHKERALPESDREIIASFFAEMRAAADQEVDADGNPVGPSPLTENAEGDDDK